jgi:hypothetical protein
VAGTIKFDALGRDRNDGSNVILAPCHCSRRKLHGANDNHNHGDTVAYQRHQGTMKALGIPGSVGVDRTPIKVELVDRDEGGQKLESELQGE